MKAVVTYSNNLGYALCSLGDYQQARKLLEHASALAARLALPTHYGYALHNLGAVLARLGDAKAGMRAEKVALEIAHNHGNSRLATVAKLYMAFISNGNATPRVLDFMRPVTDLYKVDLKGFDKKHYAQLGGKLDNVLRSIQDIHDRGFWLEIVTLVVPNFNDSDEELTRIAEFIVGVSSEIPWHVTAFHPDYKMSERRHTTANDIRRGHEIGKAAGLTYVYCGNRPGQAGETENTRCPACAQTLIERVGFRVLSNRIRDGRCPSCAATIPGVWDQGLAKSRGDGLPRPVL